ncbi:hypothetical protein EPUS_03965 [Endocarpon pusillum Z07020]|uniref:Uncharacterized protein n=1 Tax=Endocarpon pusillum (strain Z07020 / HMAS-L-300199) TaxID=1263415 RepID=U1GC44_ENDPU|nr:uncharacterized protein EPUS_03965 [Endocarpon pusillum Z07020]ERF69261.1 hypothetical protein EPUS_03965 [Endocarpon pusillum Z07020]
MATAPWTAHPHCPAHLRGEVEARVRAFPPAFLNEPSNGEVFDNVELCRERLQGFAFAQGFAITQQSGSMKQARQIFYFHCIHHGNSTRNYRKLEEHVERDEEDNITSRRKQEATAINARNCLYLIYLAFKQIGKRGSREFGLILGVKNNSHSHSIAVKAVNPLVYTEHKKALPGYQIALDLGKSLRSAHISYSAARRVLEQAGFPLDRKSYYNLRHRALSAEKDEFAGLVVALEDAGFVFECRMEEEIDQQSGETAELPLSPPRNTTIQNPFLSPIRTQITGLDLEVIEARDNLTGYARQRYENAATQAQRGLIEFAQELGNDDLHVRMPDTVKRSSWGRQFKTHDRVNKRLMTGPEAAERDANNKEQAAAREARQEASIALAASLSGPIPLAGPSPPPPPPPSTAPIDVESVLDTPPRGSAAGALAIPVTTTTTTVDRSFPTPGNEEEEEKEEEEEEAIDEAFIPPLQQRQQR